jgi:hypothetical protein
MYILILAGVATCGGLIVGICFGVSAATVSAPPQPLAGLYEWPAATPSRSGPQQARTLQSLEANCCALQFKFGFVGVCHRDRDGLRLWRLPGRRPTVNQ